MQGSATLTQTAELLRQAAQLIRDAGYKPWAPAGSEPGYSLSTALCRVTGCDPSSRHNPACLALHTRLAGYLYLSGRTTAAGDYLPSVVAIWEEYDPPHGRPTDEDVITILEHTAAIIDDLALSRPLSRKAEPRALPSRPPPQAVRVPNGCHPAGELATAGRRRGAENRHPNLQSRPG